jgi:hypothetical protein
MSNETFFSGKIGPGLFKEVYGGKPFIECLVEVIKNSRDWKATVVSINTVDKNKVVVFDNGLGMDENNLSAYISMHSEVKRDKYVSGKFDTGAKFMLFSHADICVRTIAHNNTSNIYVFEIKAEEYELKAIKNDLRFPIKSIKKNSSNWPYETITGTEISFNLRNPNSKTIIRGDDLAEELSARLPIKFADFVLVNGKNIPQKKIKGDILNIHHEDKLLLSKNGLGFLDMELYMPQNRRSEDQIRIAPHEVGEVTLKQLMSIIKRVSSEVPLVYLMEEIGGTIICPFIGEYSDQDRKSLKPEIASDPRILRFLEVLQVYSPQVEQAFGIIRNKSNSKNEEADLNSLIEICNSVYQDHLEDQQVITESKESEEKSSKESSLKKDIRKVKDVSLEVSRYQVEVGEIVEVSLKLSPSLAKKAKLEDFIWNINDSRGVVSSWSDNRSKVKILVNKEGNAKISVDLPCSSYSAVAHYSVVHKRSFALSRSQMTVSVGDQFPVIAINTDKLMGKVLWRYEGHLVQMQKHEFKLDLKATGPGFATVYAMDSGNSQISDQCSITIMPAPVKQTRILVIRGERFQLVDWSLPGNDQVVSFHEQLGDVGNLAVNLASPSYQLAATLESGQSLHHLISQICKEFATFYYLKNKNFLDVRDVKAITEGINKLSNSIYVELMTMFKKRFNGRK